MNISFQRLIAALTGSAKRPLWNLMSPGRSFVRSGLPVFLIATLLVACSDGSDTTISLDGAGTPPSNPYLADSIVPIPHGDSAQSDSVSLAGPTGPTLALEAEDLSYQHLGPGHFGVAISPKYPDGRRVIWSNGGDRISKLDYDTLAVLAEYTLPGKTLLDAATADAEIAQLDGLQGEALALALQGVMLAAKYLTGLAGVYYLLDVDNTLFVGGPKSILAYRDTDPSDPTSPIELAAEFLLPSDVGGVFVGANMTFDGHLVLPTSEGWLVVVKRDFSAYSAIQLPGAEAAAAYNQAQLVSGKRPGTFEWVRNSVAVDADGSIYAASLDHMHKVIWDGETLSTDPAKGAWTDSYLNSTGAGTGATPTLMGFGDNDRFVVITDGEALMNVVLYWRDAIPAGWATVPGAPSNRIAGQLPADMDDPSLTAIQTEQSVVVGGYGALVVNNAPATIPAGFPAAGVRSLVGYSGANPLFAPSGIQKFSWNPDRQQFEQAWATNSISSVNAVPQVSTGSNTVYTVGARNGDWTVEGIDWSTGESTFHWVTGSNRYNTLFSGMNLDQEGRIIHTTAFGIVRYDPL